MNSKKYPPIVPFFALLITTVLYAPRPATGAEATSTAADICPCGVTAYVIDTDPEGVNVRNGPGKEYAVTAILPADWPVQVHITGAKGDWMNISDPSVYAPFSEPTQYFTGWVWGPALAVATRLSGRDPSGLVPLYRDPIAGSTVVTRLPKNTPVTIAGCKGEWVKVNYKDTSGWLDPESHCDNPLTECP